MRCPICDRDTNSFWDCLSCSEIIQETVEYFNEEEQDEDLIEDGWG